VDTSSCPSALPSDAPIGAAYAWSGGDFERLDGPRAAPRIDDRTSGAGQTAPSSERLGRSRAQALFAALDELARRHVGEQLAVHVERGELELVLRRALSLPLEAATPAWGEDSAAPRNLVVDWPARDAPHLRCAFIGLDLDWCPPPPPKVVARFPGGPGSAATARS
jgi:hypothetical protein